MKKITLEQLHKLLQSVIDEDMPMGSSKTDRAFKIIDQKKVSGLTSEVRSTFFSELTNGGCWEGKGRRRPETTVRDLMIAIMLESTDNPREQNKILRDMTGAYGTLTRNSQSSGAAKRKKHCADLLEQFDGYNRADLVKTLCQAADEGNDHLTVAEIKIHLEVVNALKDKFKSGN